MSSVHTEVYVYWTNALSLNSVRKIYIVVLKEEHSDQLTQYIIMSVVFCIRFWESFFKVVKLVILVPLNLGNIQLIIKSTNIFLTHLYSHTVIC